MLGYGLALVLPSEPIGFLGLLPILLGVWKILELLVGGGQGGGDQDALDVDRVKASVAEYGRTVGKVALITLTNGGDNVATYTPLFSQAKGAEIAVYVVVYYVFLGLWLLLAFLVMKQRHVLGVARRFAKRVVPFLYLGLGIWIVVRSKCYPWAVERIDAGVEGRPGRVILGVVTAVVVAGWVGVVLWLEIRGRHERLVADDEGDMEGGEGGEGRVEEDGKTEGKTEENGKTEGKLEGAQTTDSTARGKMGELP